MLSICIALRKRLSQTPFPSVGEWSKTLLRQLHATAGSEFFPKSLQHPSTTCEASRFVPIPLHINGALCDWKACDDGRIQDTLGRIKWGTLNPSGYPCVTPKFGNERKNVRVHTLIAETFHRAQKEEKQKALRDVKMLLHVDHIDGNKENNAASNLQWLTPAEHRRKTVACLPRSRPLKSSTIRMILKNPTTGEERSILGIAACCRLLKVGFKRLTEALLDASVAHINGWDVERHPESIQQMRGERFSTIYFTAEDGTEDRVSREVSIERPDVGRKVRWFEVSTLGRVRFPRTSIRITPGTEMPDGYMMVHFQKRNFRVHRLVAEAHLQNEKRALVAAGAEQESLHVDHKDGNPGNNAVDNLQWMTPSEHRKETWRRIKLRRGSRPGGKSGAPPCTDQTASEGSSSLNTYGMLGHAEIL